MKAEIVTSGKRKASKASAAIIAGSGKITVNGKPYARLSIFRRLSIEEPINIAREVLGNTDFDIWVTMHGGGKEGQVEAARLAIARAIVKFSKSDTLKKTFSLYDKSLMIADVRRKEAYKPGDSKARSKRQKSYR
ncbi:MAG: 30S ribosomal protein S9 [Nanoarchaeota archaeon]